MTDAMALQASESLLLSAVAQLRSQDTTPVSTTHYSAEV